MIGGIVVLLKREVIYLEEEIVSREKQLTGSPVWTAGPCCRHHLGTGKFSIGPAVVALVQPGQFTIGALVSNLWSVAGSSTRADVNTMSLQYFVNYNLQKGCYLSTGPIITANWNAPSRNVWLLPFGGGFGRIFKIGNQPVNGSLSAYYNAVRPDNLPSPTWQLRVQLALLYPQVPKPKK